ncbi:MAG: hypothetical protein AB8C13_01075 [Phycisphaerales bacterium]
MRILKVIAVLIVAYFSMNSFGRSGEMDGDMTLEAAVASLDRMIEQHARSENHASVLEAAAVMDFVMSQQGIETSAGHLTLGNAYFIGNDFGRAVVHYRRGLEIAPGHQHLERNLAHVRSFVEPTVPEDEFGWNLKAVLLSWQGVVSRWTLWFIVVGAIGVGCLLWSVKVLRTGRVMLTRASIVLILLGAGGIALLGYEQFQKNDAPGAVVILAGTGFYSGPGSAVYQEVYDGALGVGTETWVLEERGEWSRIELMNGEAGWVTTRSLELITRLDASRVF